MRQIKATFDKTTGRYCLAWDDIEKIIYPMSVDDVLRPELEKNLGKDIVGKMWPEISEWCGFHRQRLCEEAMAHGEWMIDFYKSTGEFPFDIIIMAGRDEPLYPPLDDLKYWGKHLQEYGVEIVKE